MFRVYGVNSLKVLFRGLQSGLLYRLLMGILGVGVETIAHLGITGVFRVYRVSDFWLEVYRDLHRDVWAYGFRI